MVSGLIQSHLDVIDTHISQVSRYLLDPSSGDLHQASVDLQAAVLELARLPQLAAPDRQAPLSLNVRLRQTKASLDACRETLMRRTTLTESSLSTLMPATRSATYAAPATAKYSRQPYGSAGRQSGEFRATSA